MNWGVVQKALSRGHDSLTHALALLPSPSPSIPLSISLPLPSGSAYTSAERDPSQKTCSRLPSKNLGGRIRLRSWESFSFACITALQVEIIGLFLIYEYYHPSGSASAAGWDPYLCLLPRKEMSTMFWTDERLQALNNLALLNR